jgi:hypothetical protein
MDVNVSKKFSNTRLQVLKKKKEVIDARIKKVEAIEATKKRKQQKHLRYLVGEYFLNEAIQSGTIGELKAKLLETLKRENDKALVKELEEGKTL